MSCDPCCSNAVEGIGGWAAHATDTELLRVSVALSRPCADTAGQALLGEVVNAAMLEIRARSAGVVAHRTAPLPPCICPDLLEAQCAPGGTP